MKSIQCSHNFTGENGRPCCVRLWMFDGDACWPDCVEDDRQRFAAFCAKEERKKNNILSRFIRWLDSITTISP